VYSGVGTFSVNPVLRRRRQGRDSAIRRIDDKRSSPAPDNFGSAVKPKFIVGTAQVRIGSSITAIPVALLQQLLFVCGRFGWC
jgi:hypothetical protein